MNKPSLGNPPLTRKSFQLGLLCGAAGLANVGSAEEDHPYSHWTVGPYLQNPAPTAMTLCFVSDHAQGVSADVKDLSGKGAIVRPAVATPIPGTAATVWKVRLEGLDSGTRYAYRIRYKADGKEVVGKQYTFKTPSLNAAEARCMVVNDVHNRTATVEALMKHVKPEDYDFSILLGDCWNDPSWSGDGKKLMTTLAEFIKLLNGHEKPMLYSRGNHECRGYFSGKIGYLFDLPNLDPTASYYEQNYYYSLRVGPLYLLFNDCGEDGDKRKDKFDPYRQRQTGWLADEIKKPEYRSAKYHVFASHIPLYNVNDWQAKYCRGFWSPVLAKADIDLALGGHDHQWRVLEKNGACANGKCEHQGHVGQCGHSAPYPLFIGGGPSLQQGTVMLLEASRKSLKIRTIDTKGKTLAKLTVP